MTATTETLGDYLHDIFGKRVLLVDSSFHHITEAALAAANVMVVPQATVPRDMEGLDSFFEGASPTPPIDSPGL